MKACPSKEYLDTLFIYDPTTGRVTRKISRGKSLAGSPVGTEGNGGFYVMIDRENWVLARIIWVMQTGEDPAPNEIDHRDTNCWNNRWLNLRLATSGGNSHNNSLRHDNTTDVKGISYNRQKSQWHAYVSFEGRRHQRFLAGCEAEGPPVELVNWLQATRQQLHGSFSNDG